MLAFNPSTQEAEAGSSLGIRGQPGLQSTRASSWTGNKVTEKPCLKKKTKKKPKERKKIYAEER